MKTDSHANKHKYNELFFSVSELLFEADPIGINLEVNRDEYEPEVGTILPRLSSAKSVEDVHAIVYEEFLHWFGADAAGPKAVYLSVSARIWELWCAFQESG